MSDKDDALECELGCLRERCASAPDHHGLREFLEERAWEYAGEGDWAIALRSPSRRLVVRISPFDPAWSYHVDLFRADPDGPFPMLHWTSDLEGGGTVAALEPLTPVDPEIGEDFLGRLEAYDDIDDDLARTRAAIARTDARGRAKIPWWGGRERNPENVMRDGAGRLKLIEAFYVDGARLYSDVLERPERVLAEFAPEQRRYMFEIPYLIREAKPHEVLALRTALSHAERSDR